MSSQPPSGSGLAKEGFLSEEDLHAFLYRAGVIAVLMIDDASHAVPAAQALLAGGVGCIELTLRTPAAMDALRHIRAELPEMCVGVGTILTPQQVNEALPNGAAFGVAPGMNPRVVAEARRVGLPFAPGVCTPTDIEMAIEQGCRVLKFFPSEPVGGMAYLKSAAAPYAHLNLRYIPLGGIDANNAERYLSEPIILALGGSWIAPREMIRKQEWAAITQRARQVADIVKKVRPGKEQ